MLQSMNWLTTDKIAREQFQVFSQLGDKCSSARTISGACCCCRTGMVQLG